MEGSFPAIDIIAYLSDANGSFLNRKIIGQGSKDTSGVFVATIPSGTISGTSYRVLLASKGIIEIVSQESNAFEIKLIDNRPSVFISSTVSDSTFLKSIPMTVNFNNEITGFEENDIVLTNCTLGDFIKKSDSQYNFNIIPKQYGLLKLSVPENSVSNILGNGNLKQDWQIIYYSPVSVNTVNINNLIIYPNPSEGNLKVDFPSSWDSGSMEIYDISGILLKKVFIEKKNKIDIQLNLKNGTYFIKLNSIYGKFSVKKFVVIK